MIKRKEKIKENKKRNFSMENPEFWGKNIWKI